MDTLINNQNTLNIQPEIIKEAQENLKQLKIKRTVKNKKNMYRKQCTKNSNWAAKTHERNNRRTGRGLHAIFKFAKI